MPRQLTLDTVRAIGVNLFKVGNKLRVEGNYQVLAGDEVVRNVSRDVTPFISDALKATLAAAYDDLFSEVARIEVSA